MFSAGLQWQEILNVRNRDGVTPLDVVCRKNLPSSLIEKFVVAGADVHVPLDTLVCIISNKLLFCCGLGKYATKVLVLWFLNLHFLY